MRFSIKEIVYLGVYSIIFIFIIGAVFYLNISGKTGMLETVGQVYEANTEKQMISENKDRINVVAAAEAPEIRYINRSFTEGETFFVNELFEVKPAGASEFVSAATENGCSISVQDIRDKDGNSYMAGSLRDDGISEELSAVTFDKSTGAVCFHQSGIFIIRVLVWGENGRTVLGEISLPVET